MPITARATKAPARVGGGLGLGDKGRTRGKASTSARWRRMRGQLGGYKKGPNKPPGRRAR